MVQTAQVAAAVRTALKNSPHSIASLASEVGMAEITLGRRVAGVSTFRVDELVLISMALRIPFRELVPEVREVAA